MRKSYIKRLIDTHDKASSKRFLALVMSGHLIITSFFVLFAKFEILNAKLLADAMLYDMIIVLMAIFGMGVDGAVDIITAKFKFMGRRNRYNMFGEFDEDNDYNIHQTIIGGNITPDTPENP